MGAIKNVGTKAIDNIIEARQGLGNFKSLTELCESVDLQLANKRVFESLIKSGACDSLGENRAKMLKDLQASMEQGKLNNAINNWVSQVCLILSPKIQFPKKIMEVMSMNGMKWPGLKFEKESIGFYITGHPLDRFQKDLARFTDATSASVAEFGNNKAVSIAGIPIKHLPKTTRKGDKMGIITLEDLHGSIEVILWPEIYAKVEPLLLTEEPILVKGQVDSEGNMAKVIASEVFPLIQAKQRFQGRVMIHFRLRLWEKKTLYAVKEIWRVTKGITIPGYISSLQTIKSEWSPFLKTFASNPPMRLLSKFNLC
ncbi:MAG: hypothetical protein CM1200mP16_08280 [Nitrospina sp.]|nr:MAG: hypothetical protein CM1200mP16_08280 [Nitrospina sp.]